LQFKALDWVAAKPSWFFILKCLAGVLCDIVSANSQIDLGKSFCDLA